MEARCGGGAGEVPARRRRDACEVQASAGGGRLEDLLEPVGRERALRDGGDTGVVDEHVERAVLRPAVPRKRRPSCVSATLHSAHAKGGAVVAAHNALANPRTLSSEARSSGITSTLPVSAGVRVSCERMRSAASESLDAERPASTTVAPSWASLSAVS